MPIHPTHGYYPHATGTTHTTPNLCCRDLQPPLHRGMIPSNLIVSSFSSRWLGFGVNLDSAFHLLARRVDVDAVARENIVERPDVIDHAKLLRLRSCKHTALAE